MSLYLSIWFVWEERAAQPGRSVWMTKPGQPPIMALHVPSPPSPFYIIRHSILSVSFTDINYCIFTSRVDLQRHVGHQRTILSTILVSRTLWPRFPPLLTASSSGHSGRFGHEFLGKALALWINNKKLTLCRIRFPYPRRRTKRLCSLCEQLELPK